jgi:pimeloyl-ACP methyl ester carboxylesterase
MSILTMARYVCAGGFFLLLVLVSLIPAHAQHLPDGATDWYLETGDGTNLYVAEFGAAAAPGDTVVVLHGGWGAEHSYLWPAVEPLADQYRFVLYDQRGSLRSPAPDSTVSLQRFVADLEALRRELGQDRLTIFAHSMGSRLAYAYLKQHPEHVRRLALAGPLVPTGAPDVDGSPLRKTREEFVQWAKKREAAEVAEEGLDRDSLSDREKTARWRIGFASGNIYHIERWRQMRGGRAFYNGDVARLINQNTPDTLRANQFGALQSSGVPVHVIVGDHDLVDFGLATWPAVAESLDNVKITTLEHAGHNAWIDRPGRFHDALRRALSALGE